MTERFRRTTSPKTSPAWRDFVGAIQFLGTLALTAYFIIAHQWYTLVALPVSFLLLISPWVIWEVMKEEKAQSKLDQGGQYLTSRLVEGKKLASTFDLFLRPFDNKGDFATPGHFDKELYSSNINHGHPGKPPFDEELHEALLFNKRWISSSDLIVEILDGQDDLLALGNPSQLSKITNVTVDEADWKTAVSTAIASANVIHVIPATNAGTFWELEEIRRLGALEKTIFLLPHPSWIPSWNELSDSDAHAALMKLGLRCDQLAKGGVATFFSSGHPKYYHPFRADERNLVIYAVIRHVRKLILNESYRGEHLPGLISLAAIDT